MNSAVADVPAHECIVSSSLQSNRADSECEFCFQKVTAFKFSSVCAHPQWARPPPHQKVWLSTVTTSYLMAAHAEHTPPPSHDSTQGSHRSCLYTTNLNPRACQCAHQHFNSGSGLRLKLAGRPAIEDQTTLASARSSREPHEEPMCRGRRRRQRGRGPRSAGHPLPH
jgi:hypothetical protein